MANEAGYGKCHFYDSTVGRVARTFPQLEMETRHVLGSKNFVDGWSRGDDSPLDEDKAMGELLELVKDLRLKPKTGPFSRPLVAGVGSARAATADSTSPALT